MDFFEGIKINYLLVFATKSKFRILILKKNVDKGADMNANKDAKIDDIPPTSPKTSNKLYVSL